MEAWKAAYKDRARPPTRAGSSPPGILMGLSTTTGSRLSQVSWLYWVSLPADSFEICA